MDYYFETTMAKVTLEVVTRWFVVAAVAAVILCCFRRHFSCRSYISLVLLAFYLSFVLFITVFERVPSSQYQYELELFWSYRAAFSHRPELLWENFWNVVLFVPVGMLLSTLFIFSKSKITQKIKWWHIPVCGFLLSTIVELIQLVTRRGLFEFDDIFHNTFGAAIGLTLYLFVDHFFLHGIRKKGREKELESGRDNGIKE